jgi:hypothetical protein
MWGMIYGGLAEVSGKAFGTQKGGLQHWVF